MSYTKISKRYAKALFEFALEEKVLEQIYADMVYLQQLCKVSDDYVRMLKSPVIKISKKLEITKAVLQGNVSAISMKFLTLIFKARREEIIPSLTEQFVLLYKDAKGLKTVQLKASRAVTDEVKNKIKEILEKQVNKTIEIEETIEPDLIGGFILKIDDLQYDNSIKSKLASMKTLLSQEV